MPQMHPIVQLSQAAPPVSGNAKQQVTLLGDENQSQLETAKEPTPKSSLPSQSQEQFKELETRLSRCHPVLRYRRIPKPNDPQLKIHCQMGSELANSSNLRFIILELNSGSSTDSSLGTKQASSGFAYSTELSVVSSDRSHQRPFE
ncbi:hypothetical protein M378DRAFT_12697 [Amanita muscaria Koide BX008]|uniref:Uncharacterized protein n=1 Tax=Amanita muscaria (strain Koide BX008) TaxID=946122 RepID=A0A0C2SHK0_AMAMK|nr:hypothetical protein M378DRAFT_12697 [Amanita muscaria Koide BX008]